jgi:hypothetical protein
VRSINLLKIAAEAELLRLRMMVARQVRRGIFGAVAVVFGVAVLALAEVAGWQALRLKFQSIPATPILLGINLAIAAVFGVLAARSAPGHTEQEALRVRRQALETAISVARICGVASPSIAAGFRLLWTGLGDSVAVYLPSPYGHGIEPGQGLSGTAPLTRQPSSRSGRRSKPVRSRIFGTLAFARKS